MHKRAFGGVGGHTRIAAALLAVSIALGGGSAIAHADGPAGAYSNGPVSFFDQWTAHDSQLQLAEGGVGTLTLGEGAMNTDQWSVTWTKNPSDSITITLASLVPAAVPGWAMSVTSTSPPSNLSRRAFNCCTCIRSAPDNH